MSGCRALNPDAAALRIDEAPGDRQTETGASAPRIEWFSSRYPEELLEHALAQLLWDARTFVRDGDPHVGFINARCPYRDTASARRVFTCVVQQDVDDLG